MADTGRLVDVYTQINSFSALKFAQTGAAYDSRARDWRTDVYWFHGTTGTGKTRTAYRITGEDVYFCNESLLWWDGYDGHKDIIIDDFRASFCKLEYLLRLCDRYPFRVAVKGAYRCFLAKRIFITSSHSPESIFDGVGDNVNQLLRRIRVVRLFTGPDNEYLDADDRAVPPGCGFTYDILTNAYLIDDGVARPYVVVPDVVVQDTRRGTELAGASYIPGRGVVTFSSSSGRVGSARSSIPACLGQPDGGGLRSSHSPISADKDTSSVGAVGGGGSRSSAGCALPVGVREVFQRAEGVHRLVGQGVYVGESGNDAYSLLNTTRRLTDENS